MKKLLYILSLTLLTVVAMQAQEVVDIRRMGENIRVIYSLPEYSTKRDYTLTIRPVIVGGENQLELNPIVLIGSQKQKLVERRATFQKSFVPDFAEPMRKIEAITDTIFYAYKPNDWLLHEKVRLKVHTEREGCCTIEKGIEGGGEPYDYQSFQDSLPPLRRARSHVPNFTIIDSLHSGVLHPVTEYEPYTTSRILSREEGALYVHYDVSDSVLTRSFRQNAVTLDSIMFLVEQLMADTFADIQVIQIVGLASIDGPHEKNELLAGGRANALKRYIQEGYSRQPRLSDSLFEVANGGEAWSEFRYQVSQAQFEGREAVLQLTDSIQDVEERERAIKRLNGGKTYEYIRENLLGDQRNSGYIRVYYDIVPDEAAKEINEAVALLQDYKWDEAMPLLWKNRDDERVWTALGVALYMTGRETEALEYWQKAADNGDTEAKMNLERIKN